MKTTLNLNEEKFIPVKPYVKEVIFNGLEGTDLTFTIKLTDLGLKINQSTHGKLAEKICNAIYDIYIEEIN